MKQLYQNPFSCIGCVPHENYPLFFFYASTLLANTPLASLTQSEREWLATNPTIRVGMDSAYAPYEWLGEDGHFMGMAVDYLRLMEQKLGVRFDIIKGTSWAQAIEMTKRGEIDLLTSIVKLLSVQSILSFRPLIVTPEP